MSQTLEDTVDLKLKVLLRSDLNVFGNVHVPKLYLKELFVGWIPERTCNFFTGK